MISFEDSRSRPLGTTWPVDKVPTIALVRAIQEILDELEKRI